jgi:Holliday junction resolvasome RuvABC endonuclease subunit
VSFEFRLLGLDPGGSTGYAWTEEPHVSVERSGVWQLGKITKPGRRFGYLLGQLDLFEPTHVAYEKPHGLRGKAALWWHAGYLATVQLWCERNGAALGLVHPKTLKEFAAGSGRADKDQMRQAACRRFKNNLPMDFDHNRVDALWVLAWGLREFGFECTDGALVAGGTT